MKDDTAPPDPSLWRIGLFNKLLVCTALLVWALNLVPAVWLVSSRGFFPSWLRINPSFLTLPIQKAEQSIRVENASRMLAYGMALQRYAQDHPNHRFPVQLNDLVPDYLSAHEAQPYRDPQDGQARDWVYFPGYTLSSSRSTILMAAPVADGANRSFYFLSGQANSVTEKVYQQLRQAQPPRQW